MKYSPTFKHRAATMVLDRHSPGMTLMRTCQVVGGELGVNAGSLRTWTYEVKRNMGTPWDRESMNNEILEIPELEKTITFQDEVIEGLLKTVKYLSNDPC